MLKKAVGSVKQTLGKFKNYFLDTFTKRAIPALAEIGSEDLTIEYNPDKIDLDDTISI